MDLSATVWHDFYQSVSRSYGILGVRKTSNIDSRLHQIEVNNFVLASFLLSTDGNIDEV